MAERVDPLEDNPALELLVGVGEKSTDERPRQSRQIDQKRASAVKRDPEPVPVKSAFRSGVSRMHLSIPSQLMDRVERICYYTPGMTKTKFLVSALEVEARKHEKEHGPFPEMPED